MCQFRFSTVCCLALVDRRIVLEVAARALVGVNAGTWVRGKEGSAGQGSHAHMSRWRLWALASRIRRVGPPGVAHVEDCAVEIVTETGARITCPALFLDGSEWTKRFKSHPEAFGYTTSSMRCENNTFLDGFQHSEEYRSYHK